MRALPFLAAILFTAPFAAEAKSELELLQDRCHEQERQIRQLEEENSRLKLMSTASQTPAATQAPAAKGEAAASKAADKPAASTAEYGVVRKGDTLTKIAKRHGTTPETLAKLNKIKNPAAIQIGQKLVLPSKPAPAVAKTSTAAPAKTPAAEKPATPVHGTHIVKSGETFYSIARHYGLSPEVLQATNPSIKPASLRAGQTLTLGGKQAPAAAPAPVAAKKQSSSSKQAEAPKETAKKEAAPASPAASTPAPAPVEIPATEMASNTSTPRVRLISIDTPTDFSAFAAAHGTSTAKLNALNGQNLNSSTVLAKGSELYVPAQP